MIYDAVVFYKVEINVDSQENADLVLNALLEKKLVTGGQMIQAPARYHWQGEIVDLAFFAITSFTVETHKQQIITTVESVSIEEFPMIAFSAIEASEKLEKWIRSTVLS